MGHRTRTLVALVLVSLAALTTAAAAAGHPKRVPIRGREKITILNWWISQTNVNNGNLTDRQAGGCFDVTGLTGYPNWALESFTNKLGLSVCGPVGSDGVGLMRNEGVRWRLVSGWSSPDPSLCGYELRHGIPRPVLLYLARLPCS